MTMFLLNNSPLSLDVPFTHEGVNYPANWLRLASPEERAAIGITEAPDEPTYDQRFYWGPNNPKDYLDLVAQQHDVVRQQATQLLSTTDWLIIREADNGKPVPQETKDYRQAVREAASLKYEALNGVGSVEDLIGLLGDPGYQSWPSES